VGFPDVLHQAPCRPRGLHDRAVAAIDARGRMMEPAVTRECQV